MAGHSKWKQIKEKKGKADEKRGAIFSKLLAAISVTARGEPNPQANPTLRAAIEKAKQNNVPQENIERAISRTSATDKPLEELTLECYGPEGSALILEVITDSRNRTIAEIKKILSDHGGKLGDKGSVRWAFEKTAEGWHAKFPQQISADAQEKLARLTEDLENHGDVQNVHTNIP